MTEKIKLGISTCLLGEKVRYDGGHKLDHYLRDTLGPFVVWVPVCPEVECGLPVPREAMRLIGHPDHPRLVTNRTGVDHTEKMVRWTGKKLRELKKKNISGFVFKSRSPSSGMRGVKIYTEGGMPSRQGSGIFAGHFMRAFPLMPVEDDGRLHDPALRENFIERIFVYRRWQDMTVAGLPPPGRLVDFHSDHKLLIMAHSSRHLRELGRLVALGKKKPGAELFGEYLEKLMEGLKLKATVKKNVNVLQHMMGYFKKVLSADEKKELMEGIEHYHHGLFPLIAPMVLFKHHVRKYGEPYLARQVYLNPHPIELMLRNHV